jgi:hypothetical protein
VLLSIADDLSSATLRVTCPCGANHADHAGKLSEWFIRFMRSHSPVHPHAVHDAVVSASDGKCTDPHPHIVFEVKEARTVGAISGSWAAAARQHWDFYQGVEQTLRASAAAASMLSKTPPSLLPWTVPLWD